jgi:hypothetical protein
LFFWLLLLLAAAKSDGTILPELKPSPAYFLEHHFQFAHNHHHLFQKLNYDH